MAEERVPVDNKGRPIAPPKPNDRTRPPDLTTAVTLSMGVLFYRSRDPDAGKVQAHHCVFQFNPTEIERSRNISFTRSGTGNNLEEGRVGGRNAAKRKQTRKPDSWEMSMTLRFDAGYGKIAWTKPSQLRETARTGTLSSDLTAEHTEFNPLGAHYKDEIQRIDDTIKFFERIADAQPWAPENEKIANANETPPPPYVMLAFGNRVWECAVKSVRIKEEDYTPDLCPRRFEVTLGLEIIQTVPQNNQSKGTAR